MEISFRNYRPTDFDELVSMVIGLYSKDGKQATHMSREKVALSVEKLTAAGSSGQLFIFEKSGEIAGYAIVNRFWSNEFSGQIGYLDELFVKPAYRSLGIGAQFFEHLSSNPAMDCVAFMLETVQGNNEAVRFYKKLGFETHHNHLMFKKIDSE